MPMSKDEVFSKVREVLVAALAVDEEEVKPESRLTEDLGAESIDFLDITFQLEKTFGIKIPKGELIPESVFSDPKYVKDGKVTPEGIAELKVRIPWADLSKFEADPDIKKFTEVFTVEVIVKYVMSKVS